MVRLSGNTCSTSPFIFNHLTTREGLLSHDIRSIDRDKEGYWWIAGDNGLQRFDGKNFKNFRHQEGDLRSLPGDRIFSIYVDRSGRIWIATFKGLCRYIPDGENFERYPLKTLDGNLNYPVRFFEDRSGTLWMSVFNTPILFRLRQNHRVWEELHLPEGIKTNGPVGQDIRSGQLFSFFRRSDGRNFFGKITAFKDKVDIQETLLHPRLSNLGQFVVDKQNHLVGNQILPNEDFDDIVKVHLTNGKSVIYPVYDAKVPLHQGRNGEVWFFSPTSEEFGYIKDDKIVRYCWPVFKENGQKLNPDMNHIEEDEEGNIWLATKNGLYVFNPYHYRIKKTEVVKTKTGEEKIFDVLTLFESTKGHVWVGTYFNGIFVLDKNLGLIKKIFFETPVGYKEPSRTSIKNFNAVWSFFEDVYGNIWAGGQLGHS